jgi:hypothetical protein
MPFMDLRRAAFLRVDVRLEQAIGPDPGQDVAIRGTIVDSQIPFGGPSASSLLLTRTYALNAALLLH